MLDGERLDSRVGSVEIHHNMEVDPYECVIFFKSSCTDCDWKGEMRDNEECTTGEARTAMEEEAREHMRTSHPLVQLAS